MGHEWSMGFDDVNGCWIYSPISINCGRSMAGGSPVLPCFFSTATTTFPHQLGAESLSTPTFSDINQEGCENHLFQQLNEAHTSITNQGVLKGTQVPRHPCGIPVETPRSSLNSCKSKHGNSEAPSTWTPRPRMTRCCFGRWK